ncbi:DUF4974 domain-containing protein [Puteibacter caeruleilacunae]|nr:DUF4974 domain-containing protein [Puteibacter caeruleilacunae]
MKNLDFDKQLLLKFLLKKTSSEEDDQIRTWLEEDKGRYNELDKLLRAASIMESDNDQLWVKSDKKRVLSRIKSRNMRRTILRVAAVFIGLLIVSSIFFIPGEQQELVQEQTIQVEKGKKEVITLADGTKVWLASDTKFVYPEQFSENKRIVKLEGQAYFEVVHNENKPFVVKTRNADVNVLGTTFNVKAYPKEQFASTVLIDGSVNVALKDNANGVVGERLLIPGQKCTFNKHSQEIEVKNVDLKHELAWRENRLSFRHETFMEIAQKIERHYNVRIIFETENISNKRLTGKFQKETLSEVLETFQEWTSFEFTINDSTVIIKD